MLKTELPLELKNLVSNSVKLLGRAIYDVYGERLYNHIEALRVKMKLVRGKEAGIVEKALEDIYLTCSTSKTEDLHKVAKAFSLMLELINSCEAAYRTSRLKNLSLKITKAPQSLVFVFTSHPTEARSQNFLLLMGKIESLLQDSLENNFEEIQDQLFYLLRIALRLDLANNRRPEVKDEAHEIFHFVLSPEILKEQVALRKIGVDVFFRTWVGGDKDGHPKVGPLTMQQSMDLSRSKLLTFIEGELKGYREEIKLTSDHFQDRVRKILTELKALKKVTSGDGRKIKAFRKSFEKFYDAAKKAKVDSPALLNLNELFWLYPTLILPLEIREDHELIRAALKNTKLPIAKMLVLLKKISQGFEAKWYVRGFVISMCQASEDILAAVSLTKKMTGTYLIPVVPLFENENGLTHSVEILKEVFKKGNLINEHRKNSGGRYEIMLGYSDSSKESGVLPGRLLVEEGLLKLEKFLIDQGLIPVFFHGSGGSVSRGGGSLKEQIAWWPQSALNIYKVTIQGEMVQRSFHQPLIVRSQVGKIIEEYASYVPKKYPQCPALSKFSDKIQQMYRGLVKDENFQDMVSQVTPYDFLSLLKIGSRPAKRTGKGVFTIRAIPWILCWTQTRLLLPFWWGLGTAWKELKEEEKNELKAFMYQSDLIQSYIKNLGFTLAKIELGVWNFHLGHSTLDNDQKSHWKILISEELSLCYKFFHEISGEENVTWFRPMLGKSIHFRSSMIHPLNVIQKISLERKDNNLLRETVTGIASGMLTTG